MCKRRKREILLSGVTWEVGVVCHDVRDICCGGLVLHSVVVRRGVVMYLGVVVMW